jgi:hypothetical protein
VQVQNLSTEASTDVSIAYHAQDGSAPYRLTSPTVPPLGATNFYLPHFELATGIHAAIASADLPIAAVARTDCARNGKAAMYGQAEPSEEVVVPLALAGYYGQCSILSVQNPDTSASISADIEFYQVGATSVWMDTSETIPPGTSVTLDLCTYEFPHDNRLDQFFGWARVTAGGALVAAQSYVDITTSDKALYAFKGVPSEAAAKELYVPLFRSRQPGQGGRHYDTGISVVNPSEERTRVDVVFHGAPGNPACGDSEYTQGPVWLPARSSAVFYQGPDEQPETGMHPLPEGCVGSATIVSDRAPILAIVNDSLNYTDESASYNATSAADAGTMVLLPLFRAGHTAWQLYTGVSAMNVGTAPAEITIRALNRDGAYDGESTMTVPDVDVHETALFWPGDFARAGDWAEATRAYGSAIVTSDQPVVVIVNDVSLARIADSATYNGLTVE